jgi:cobyrinic acid a,c-diamide synthase
MAQISSNQAMRQALQQAWSQGKPMLAECGGMMALSESVDGHTGFGLLPGRSRLTTQLQGIGTQHLPLATGTISAHTFHHGVFETPLPPDRVADTAFGKPEGLYRHGSLRASFLHFYFPSNPQVAAEWLLP